MHRRSLPERTVDAWVSVAIARAFPNARIWAPTQARIDGNWDYGISLGAGKILILEDKGSTPLGPRQYKLPRNTHRIDIDPDQLDWYCKSVDNDMGIPSYYVLPRPPWIGPNTGSRVVPDQAIFRTTSPAGAFEEWAYVIRCSDLKAQLGTRRSIYTDRLPLPGAWSLTEFFDLIKKCEIGRRVSGETETDILERKALGQSLPPDQYAGRAAFEEQVNEVTRAGSALGVFVPATDLPNWEG
jgi:hypothetical protein